MKNIHILPTDKPSNIVISTIDNKLKLNNNTNDSVEYHGQNQNIYITNSEEIKEGDWVLNISNNKIFKQDNSKYDGYTLSFYKKIILTTDELYIHNDLIPKEYNPFPQYIQKIDDEFLEWFVKNPSCEEVEVMFACRGIDVLIGKIIGQYKIIIPKEEPKKYKVMIVGDKVNEEQTKCYCGHTNYCDCGPEEPKQETTLEEVAEIILANNIDGLRDALKDDDLFFFYKGIVQRYGEVMVKWQQEQDKKLYSEEDMAQSFMACWVENVPYGIECKVSFNEWFKQFQNK
jgi:hypothetical protein